MSELPQFVRQGEKARLIPIVADTSKEQRATSSTLSVLASVDEFGHRMLKSVGAPVSKTSKISCFTEIVFDKASSTTNYRPDGLIVVHGRKRPWVALVEAKIGRSTQNKEQVEAYLDVARRIGADAVITISNQYATRPDHHPISVNKSKIRSVGLYHWSWSALLAEALLCEAESDVADPDQAFILRELVRFLDHEGSGVTSFERMPSSWKDICAIVQQGGLVSRNSSGVSDIAASWHELTRCMALSLSIAIGRLVSVHLQRRHSIDADRRLQDDIAAFVQTSRLSANFDVPDAAAKIVFSADFARRTLISEMYLESPKDRSQARALCTWIFKQVEDCPNDELTIVAKWPGRIADTMATLGQMREDRATILGDIVGQMPRAFEIREIVDLGGRFRGSKTFVEEAKKALPAFYQHVGQNLQAWVPKPPKISVTSNEDSLASCDTEKSEARSAQPSEEHSADRSDPISRSSQNWEH